MPSSKPSNDIQTEVLFDIWEHMAARYPLFTADYGASPVDLETGKLTAPGRAWAEHLTGLCIKQVTHGFTRLATKALKFPPNPATFRVLCLDIPLLSTVEHELQPGRARSAFTVLVWSKLDTDRYNQVPVKVQERMLRDAYDDAVEHVGRGDAMPQSMPALPYTPPAAIGVADRGSARAAMERAAADLGFDADDSESEGQL